MSEENEFQKNTLTQIKGKLEYQLDLKDMINEKQCKDKELKLDLGKEISNLYLDSKNDRAENLDFIKTLKKDNAVLESNNERVKNQNTNLLEQIEELKSEIKAYK